MAGAAPGRSRPARAARATTSGARSNHPPAIYPAATLRCNSVDDFDAIASARTDMIDDLLSLSGRDIGSQRYAPLAACQFHRHRPSVIQPPMNSRRFHGCRY